LIEVEGGDSSGKRPPEAKINGIVYRTY